MAIDANDDGLAKLFNAWFLDDGVLAGSLMCRTWSYLVLQLGSASYIASKCIY